MFYNFLYTSEKLTHEKLDVPEVTQSEEGQKQKLYVVLGSVNSVSKFVQNLSDFYYTFST